MTRHPKILFLLLSLQVIFPLAAHAAQWLPAHYVFHPRSRADWKEPRLGLTWHGNALHAALGSPIAIVSGGGNIPWGVTLEVLASLGLSRDDSFFPLETVDGIFQLGLEASHHGWRSKVRIVHWSAHKADGDTTVAFRDQTFSREWVSLEIGREMASIFPYARVATTWHAVPKSPGLKAEFGLIWEQEHRSGPFYAAHLNLESAQSYRLSQTHVAGWALGAPQNRLYLGIRYHGGFAPQGQYGGRREDFLGAEIQFGSQVPPPH